MLSVSQAAERLGVTSSRVRAMIKDGRLFAFKCGKAWIVQEEDVLDRLSKKPHAGRPRKREQNIEEHWSQRDISASDLIKTHQVYEYCREVFSSLPSEELMRQAHSGEEASFYMAVSDFFLQKKQDELIEQGIF